MRLVAERTEAVSQRLDDMQAKVMLALTSINNLDFHLKRLHEEVQNASVSYAIVHRFMVSHVGEPPKRRSSGSATPSSTGHLSPPGASDSQLSLQIMLHDSQRKLMHRASKKEDVEGDDGEEERQDEVEEECDDKQEEETIRGRHGAHVVKMNLDDTKKVKKIKKKIKIKVKETSEGEVKGRVIGKRRLTGRVRDNTSGVEASRIESRKSSLKKEAKITSPSRVSFKEARRDSKNKIETEGTRGRSFRRSVSQSEEPQGPAAPLYPPSVAEGSRPRIQVIPPTTPPPIITFTTSEYTSLGDELETVCMARLTPPASPRFFVEPSRPRPRHRSDSAAPFDIYGQSNPLRDAEEADYHLMEGIIQRRMHRDSENLAVSLEELCSIFSGVSDEDGEAEGDVEGGRSGASASADFRKRHSSASLDLSRPRELPYTGHRQSPSPRRRSTLFGRSLYPIGSPTHDLHRGLEGDKTDSWSPPLARLATPERFSPRSSSPYALASQSDGATATSFLLQVPDAPKEEEGMPARPSDKVITETQC